MTPDRTTTPLGGPVGVGRHVGARSGRWANHVPKRIQELRGESAAPSMQREMSPGSSRKGRPPGSKNLHRRKDAGIKKGPRRPKAAGGETPVGSEDGEA